MTSLASDSAVHPSVDGCIVCGAALTYSTSALAQVCSLCGREGLSPISCPNGHFVCDTCHAATAMDPISLELMTTTLSDPSAILEQILALPTLPMHGPEHHAIVPGVLIAAARNAGVSLPDGALGKAMKRAANVPGGWCGYYGTCGAAVGVGVAISIMTEATPLKGEERSLALAGTSFTLARMVDDQPRCCKRASRVAVAAAVDFLRDKRAIELPKGHAVRCTFSARNRECPREQGVCPYLTAPA